MFSEEEEATTTRTLRNIRKSLITSLTSKYEDTISPDKIKEIAEEILKIHGLHKENFDFVNQLGKVINETLNDVSIDENSNKNEKTIEGIQQEVVAPLKKAIGYDYLYRKIRDKFGKKIAKRITGDLFDLTLGLSDSVSILKIYCYAADFSKLMTLGRDFGQLQSKPCKRWSSYIAAVSETAHQLSNHLAGACAIGTIMSDLSHLGIYKMGITLEQLKTDPEVRKQLENEFQQFVHSVNHLSRAAVESPFTNISIFDRVKIKALIDPENYGYLFERDETITEEYIIEYIMEIQRQFMDFFDKGDPSLNGAPYRFPIISLCISKDEKDKIIDKAFVKEVCNRDIFRYNIFASTGTKIASCCFDENTEVLARFGNIPPQRISFKNLFEIKMPPATNSKIFHNGSWVRYSRVKVPYDRLYYKVTTVNNKEIVVTEDHLNPTTRGDIESRCLTVDDYLLFNMLPLDAVPEKDQKLTYEMGYYIGCHLGNGSYGGTRLEDENGNWYTHQMVLSMNKENSEIAIPIINKAFKQLGIDTACRTGTPHNNNYSVTINNKEVCYFVRSWVTGEYAHTKGLNLECLLQSQEFRKGIVDGWYVTDGGNSNRCYTTSPQLAKDMECVFTSLGIPTIIDISDRTDEPVVIRGEMYNRNYPLYCLRWYTPKNKLFSGEIYKIINNSIYFKIKSIEKVEGSPVACCVEIRKGANNPPYFTLPNGIITHNCRLTNDKELMDNFSASVNSFGGGMMNLGSHRVCTINFHRLALDADSYKHYFSLLEQKTENAAMVLAAHKDLIKDLTAKGLQQFVSNGWINFKRLFSTFGILGLYEAKKTLEKKFGKFNNGKELIAESLKRLNDLVGELSEKYGIIGNIEQIPAESFASRLAKADKLIYGEEAVPYRLYSNQFIPLWEEATIWERMKEDGKYNKLVTGGGIVHAQIGEKVTPKQAEKLISFAVECGCEHFALNAVYTKFEDDTVLLGKYEKNPQTESKAKDYYTRVVGFFTPVSSWQFDRRTWEFDKRTFIKLD